MTTSEVRGSDLLRVPPLAQRLFRDFGDLPAGAVFAAIGRARKTLREQGEAQPAPEVVEDLARGLLGAQARAQAPPRWFA